MTMITAADQRAVASAIPTEEELATKYSTAVQLIKIESSVNRKYTLPVSVSSEDLDEFTTFFEGKGFKILPLAEPEITPTPVRGGSEGTLNYRLISWADITVSTPTSPIAANSQHNWVVTTVGIKDNTVLYWKDFGTSPSSSFSDNLKQGSVTVSGGTAQISRNLVLSPLSGSTVVIKVYLDSSLTQLVAEANQVTIA